MNTSIPLSSHSSLTNPANSLKRFQCIFSYNPGYRGFGIHEMSLSGSMIVKNIATNVHIISQNHDKMNNIFLNIAHGFVLKENINIGFSVDFIQSQIKNYRSTGQVSLGGGVTVKTGEKLKVGISYLHITPSRKEKTGLLEPEYFWGISYLIRDNIPLFLTISKSEHHPLQTHFGIMYDIFKNIKFSFHYSDTPDIYNTTFIIKIKKYEISETIQWHSDLEFLHLFSLTLSL